MKLDDFDFTLPERLIAQVPSVERDLSRMMVVWRKSGKENTCISVIFPKSLDLIIFL